MQDSSARSVAQQIRDGIGRFAENPARARQLFGHLLAADPVLFVQITLPLLREADTECRLCLLDVMARAGAIPPCDPARYALETETGLVSQLAPMDPLLDVKLARRLSNNEHPLSEAATLRVLELLSQLPANTRVLPSIVRLLHDPNPHLRSKAVLLVARSHVTPQVAERLLTEKDPRVRANAVEGLWGNDHPLARRLFRQGLRDRNNRVAGNALVGMFLLGEAEAIPEILAMSAHPDPLFRATAAWVVGRTGHPRFVPLLSQLLNETQPHARTRIFRALCTLRDTALRYAEAARLQVPLLAFSERSDGRRMLRAAIATEDGKRPAVLPATGIVIWEDQRMVSRYEVHSSPVPDRISLGVFLPEGDFGDYAAASLLPRGRERDAVALVRYGPAAKLAALENAVGALSAGVRHRAVVAYLGALAPADDDTKLCEQLVVRAQAMGVAIHCVTLTGDSTRRSAILAGETGGFSFAVRDADEAVAALRRIHLHLLHAHRLIYAPSGKRPESIRLEVYTPDGYGTDTLQLV